ncbi:MAG: flavin reductase family protein [Cyclobacteriaceae bacterium]
MSTVDPNSVSVAYFHSILLGAVAPRPIALASTIDTEGKVNLSPFSFFNAFSVDPPILIFSPSLRIRDNTSKHTLENVMEMPEVVINMVDYPIVEQMSLSSTEYDKGVNEFVKAGFSEVPSEKVTPPRVGESPISFECRVVEIKPLGTKGGAGNLIICEVILAHINDRILTEDQKIDPSKLELVARMGGNWFTNSNSSTLFQIPKPIKSKGIGFDNLPDHILKSTVLTGNQLARLANIEKLPSKEEVDDVSSHLLLNKIIGTTDEKKEVLHRLGQKYIDMGDIELAWKILLYENDRQ